MLFNGLEANIQGGIGSQLMRTMACAGEAIENNVKAEHILMKVVEYTDNKELYYHNSEALKDYIKTKMNIIRTRQRLIKSYNFNDQMSDLINRYYTYERKHEYINIDNHIKEDGHHEYCYWIRGKDRPSNMDVFKQIMETRKEKGKGSNSYILTNDEDLLKKSLIVSSNFKKRDPIEDFKILLNSKNITTQLSGFSISPFLLSPKPQRLYLIGKEHHRSKDFPNIDKDWNFYTGLLKRVCIANKNKKLIIVS